MFFHKISCDISQRNVTFRIYEVVSSSAGTVPFGPTSEKVAGPGHTVIKTTVDELNDATMSNDRFNHLPEL